MTVSRDRYHHGDLRTAMIQTAARMAAELGPEAVTVREVARRAGVSSGAPFHHFPTRQALMTAMAEAATHELRQHIEAAVAEIPETKPSRRLRAIGRAFLGWVADHPAQYKAMSEHRSIGDGPAIESLMRDTLRQAIRGRAADIERPLLEMRAMACGLARMFVDGHLRRWTETEALEQIQTVLDDHLARLLGKKPK